MGNIAEYDRRREWREKRVYNFVAANISQYGPSPVTYRNHCWKARIDWVEFVGVPRSRGVVTRDFAPRDFEFSRRGWTLTDWSTKWIAWPE